MHCLWTRPSPEQVLAGRRCRFSRPLARNQDGVFKIRARRRTAIIGHDPPVRTRHLAAAILGAYDPRRARLRHTPRLCPFQSGEARFGRAPGAVAAFLLSSLVAGGLSRQVGSASAARLQRPVSGDEIETAEPSAALGWESLQLPQIITAGPTARHANEKEAEEGAAVFRATLATSAQQKEATRRRAEGATLAELAHSYAVGISTIRRATRAA